MTILVNMSSTGPTSSWGVLPRLEVDNDPRTSDMVQVYREQKAGFASVFFDITLTLTFL
jgi:hypothetical protein